MAKINTLFLSFMFINLSVDATKFDYPEAFADLDQSAFNLIELSHNKSNELKLRLKTTELKINLNSAKANASKQSISFSQSFAGGHINATKGDNSLFGQIHLNNKHFILTTNTAGIWAVELPTKGLQFNDCDLLHSPTSSVKLTPPQTTDKLTTNKAAGTIIDVLIVYDLGISNRYPGNLLQARVDQYFHVANQTYANSNLDLALRQVGLQQVDYNYNNSNETLRDHLQESLSGVTYQGLETVRQLREDTGADLVIFLRPHNIETRGSCGIAFFPVASSSGLTLNSTYGVNVMADGMSSWSICTDQLMVHEVGHNLGAGHHNWDPTEYDYLAEARGFAKIGQFGTVMGSFATGDPNRLFELDYFSNPDVQCGGGPCGIPGTADNVSVINQLKDWVADYKPVVSTTSNPQNFNLVLTDLDGDGILDDVDEFPFDANETTDSDGDGVGDNSDAFPNDATEQIDTDYDGLGNRVDPDDDNDGVPDDEDTFPLNASENKDSDLDGVGDYADAFEFENTESADSDADGIGNNSETDDDNDGVADVSDTLQDLLVISVGNNRILRFDAQTGLAKGIEVLPDDGWLTFQSDMALDRTRQILYYSSASSVRTHDLLNRDSTTSLFIPAYSDDGSAQLGTGFPTALEHRYQNGNPHLYVSKLRSTTISDYFLQNPRFPQMGIFTDLADEEDDTENVIDMYWHNDQMFVLSQTTNAFNISQDGTTVSAIGSANLTWLHDPYAFVVHAGVMIHTDQSRNKLLMTDVQMGSYAGIFADLLALGYSNPTGIELTNDGRLLVAVSDQNAILAFNLDSQEFLGELANGFGLNQPHKILLVPQLQDRFHEDADKVIRPNAGNWFNPASSGRGFNIGIFDNRLQVLWFTYDIDGNPIWYTAADLLVGHTFSTDLLKTTQSSDGSVTVESIGQITLEFANEREAMMSWQIGHDSGQENIYWLQFSVEPDVAGYTGMWTRADAPGWGAAIINNGDKTIAIPFIYDDNGEPRWVISDVAEGEQPFNFSMNTVFSETLCPMCSGESNVQIEQAGSMTFDLSGTAYWSSDLTWPTPITGAWNLNQTGLIRISSEPTRPR